MKIIPFIKNFEKNHFNETLIIGVIVGIGVGMFLFSSIVPDPSKVTRAYQMVRSGDTNSNKIMMIQASRSPMMQNNFGYATVLSSESANSMVKNEKQFLSELVTQNENTIRLAHRVLSLTGISETTSGLAEKIIVEKTLEISSLKDLLTPKTTTAKSKTR